MLLVVGRTSISSIFVRGTFGNYFVVFGYKAAARLYRIIGEFRLFAVIGANAAFSGPAAR